MKRSLQVLTVVSFLFLSGCVSNPLMFDEVKGNKEARLNLLKESKDTIYEQWKSGDSGFLIVVKEDSLNRYKTNSVSEKIIELVESDFDISNATCFFLEKPSIASDVFQYSCEKIYYDAALEIEQQKTLQKILSTHAELVLSYPHE